MQMEITILRSKRKHVTFEIRPDLSVIVRAPLRISKRELDRILTENEDRIRRHMEKIRKKREAYRADETQKLTSEELKQLAERAKEYIPERVAYFAPIVGVEYGRITIRNQKTRWGSCSSRGNLNFNCLLMLAPSDVIDYVVVHELCHRKEMNHSKAFWAEVEKILPAYKTAKKWLREQGGLLMERAGAGN